MAEVTAYEAKTQLSRLLHRVQAGERITITRHGVPVAVLAPVPEARPMAPVAVEQMRRFREGRRLGGLSLRDLIEEGRR